VQNNNKLVLVGQQYFSYIMATSFCGGRRWSTRREPPTMGKQLYHLGLRVECTLICNLQNRARTHAVLVTDLYELLGNPTTAAPKIEWSLGNNKINKYTYFVLLSALIGVADGFKFNSSSIENLKVKNNTIL
jgi:hypothetical protein